jgi:hypothetical protein
MGPIVHLPERLANRSRDYPAGIDRAAFRRRLDPVYGERLKTSAHRMHRELYALALMADLTPEQLRRCQRALARFWAKEAVRNARTRAADARPHARRRRTG